MELPTVSRKSIKDKSKKDKRRSYKHDTSHSKESKSRNKKRKRDKDSDAQSKSATVNEILQARKGKYIKVEERNVNENVTEDLKLINSGPNKALKKDKRKKAIEKESSDKGSNKPVASDGDIPATILAEDKSESENMTRLEPGDNGKSKRKQKKSKRASAKKTKTLEQTNETLAEDIEIEQSKVKDVDNSEDETVEENLEVVSPTKKYKTGRYTDEEDKIIWASMKEYISQHGFDKDEGLKMLLEPLKSKDRRLRNAWTQIAAALPQRKRSSVFDHARRRFSTVNYKGRWSSKEEDKLRDLYNLHGADWVEIGLKMGKLPQACRDKWRQIKNENRNIGPWSEEETSKLIEIVKEMHDGKMPDPGVKIPWSNVSKEMDTRSWYQCQVKWGTMFGNKPKKS